MHVRLRAFNVVMQVIPEELDLGDGEGGGCCGLKVTREEDFIFDFSSVSIELK